MIDLHCHLLPIGDGPRTDEESMQLFRTAAAQGVTVVVAVCHHSVGRDECMAELCARFGPAVEALGIRLTWAVEYDYAHLSERIEWHTPDGRGRFLLVDLNSGTIPPGIEALLYEFERRGERLVLVHPERLLGPEDVPALCALRERGVVIQVNAASFLPTAPRMVRKMIGLLMRRGAVDCVASDAHRVTGSRRLCWDEARMAIVRRYGEEALRMLLEINPARLIEGRDPLPLPRRPSMADAIRGYFRKFHWFKG